jgi:hypothetical protein
MTFCRSAWAHVVVLTVALGGCGERVEAGLANAPSIERKSEPRNQYDIISNGDEGCTNRNGGPGIASAAGACPKRGSQIVADAGPDPSPR